LQTADFTGMAVSNALASPPGAFAKSTKRSEVLQGSKYPQQPPESYLTQFHSLSRGRKAPPERLKSLGQMKVRWL
tara:strand:- start:320 stop:544 length:225 start_codon:yes stop_codon:yes gene_type:complete